jgi:hypothetical protein
MSAALVETFTPPQPAAITIVDGFVRDRGTHGAFAAPLSPVRFVLTARVVANVETPLEPPVVLQPATRGTGIFVFGSGGIAGTGAPLTVPPDRYVLAISSDAYQTETRVVDWPVDPSATVVVLQPGSAYPFPDLAMVSNNLTLIRGNVLAPGDGAPVAGATVSITAPANTWPFATCRTGADGGWVLAIPVGATAAPFNATLHVALPDGTAFNVQPFAVAPGRTNALRQTALRGSVLSTNGAPVARAAVTVGGVAGTAITGRDGAWTFALSPIQPNAQLAVTATAPSGAQQTQNAQVQTGVTVSVPAFRIATA